jgi:hypothetical protein
MTNPDEAPLLEGDDVIDIDPELDPVADDIVPEEAGVDIDPDCDPLAAPPDIDELLPPPVRL